MHLLPLIAYEKKGSAQKSGPPVCLRFQELVIHWEDLY